MSNKFPRGERSYSTGVCGKRHYWKESQMLSAWLSSWTHIPSSTFATKTHNWIQYPLPHARPPPNSRQLNAVISCFWRPDLWPLGPVSILHWARMWELHMAGFSSLMLSASAETRTGFLINSDSLNTRWGSVDAEQIYTASFPCTSRHD